MDPKSLPSLDPKLKEAYERVMGTSLPNGSPAAPVSSSPQPVVPVPPPAAPEPVSAPNPIAAAPSTTPAETLQPQPMHTTPPSTPMSTGPTPISAPKPITSSGGTFVAKPAEGSNKGRFSPVILIVAGAIFFVVYTLFWLRFFNVGLPFLP